MGRKADKVKAEAESVERRLRATGLYSDAEAVARLRRGYASACATLRVLHRDNMALRQRLGLPSFCEAHGIAIKEPSGNVVPVAAAPTSPPPPKPRR